jgi:hypothetical protein
MFMDTPKQHFAASVSSHCKTVSLRDEYIEELLAILGPTRVHRYGQCGDREAPPKPFKNTLKLLAHYKLYVLPIVT